MADIKQQRTAPIISYGQMNMHNDCRAFTAQMSFLSRAYVASVAADFGNEAFIANRLYGLPMQIVQKVQLVFGAPSMDTILHLIQMHVIHLITLINSMKAGDRANVDASTALLYRNANEISERLAGINPFWDQANWRNLFYVYIVMSIEEAISLMTSNFEKNLDISDRLLHHALFMGDYLATGMIQYLSVAQRSAGMQRLQTLKKAKAAGTAGRTQK